MLLFVDGFDAYGISGSPHGAVLPTGVLARKYAQEPGVYAHIDTGRYGAYAFYCDGYPANMLITPDLTTNSTMIVGFAIKFVDFTNSFGGNIFFKMFDTGTLGVNLVINGDGHMQVFSGATLLGTTSTTILTGVVWVVFYLEDGVFVGDADVLLRY